MTEPDPHGGMSQEQIDEGIGYLVLRHLYDGDVIDYPVPEDNELRRVFDRLERKRLIARWDRMWPMRDRYRLTEAGIAEIEKRYKPAEAEQVYSEMQSTNVPVTSRRRWLHDRGYDPFYWGAIHDPYTHWSTWGHDHGRYHRYVHEAPPEPATPAAQATPAEPAGPVVEDLDRQAGGLSQHERGLGVPVTDVS